jgi:hypothetical protein
MHAPLEGLHNPVRFVPGLATDVYTSVIFFCFRVCLAYIATVGLLAFGCAVLKSVTAQITAAVWSSYLRVIQFPFACCCHLVVLSKFKPLFFLN